MALTGLDIFKKLPKENCKECGVPTCLAFAMKVASGQVALDACPRLSDEAMSDLGDASAPPQKLVSIGVGDNAVEIGQETVLYRHDEKFHHPTGIAMELTDAGTPEALAAACADFKALSFTRVGQEIAPDMVALINESGDAATFAEAAGLIHNTLGVPMVLVSPNAAALSAAATGPLAGQRPLLYCSGEDTVDELAKLAEEAKAPICVGGDIDSVAAATEALAAKGIKDIVISPGGADLAEALEFLTRSRRAALKKTFRPLGYPVMAIACDADKSAAALDACAYVCKYAGIVVTNAWEPYNLVPILTTRQNIYTDPQKPVQVEPRLYDVGEVTADSPLLITTNFSLSYYSVEAEVEAARVPCRILAVDTEGTSVLTAWAADKFNTETIADAVKACGAEGLLSHHNLIIPGHVAVLAAGLADDSGWKVSVGPKDASGIGPYLKNEWQAAS